jgi:O-antigen/teichoic acid export membrane protein
LSHEEIAQRSTRGSFALFIGNLLNAIITAVSVIAITRLLGPSEYGAYTLVILVPSILLNFLGLGVSSGITRYAAYYLARNEPAIARRMTVNGLLFLVTFGVLLSAICYASAGLFSTFVLHRPELAGLVRFASLLVLAQTLFTSAIAGLLGWSYMGQMGISYVFQSSLRVVLAVGLVLAGFGVAGAIAGYSGSLTLASIAAVAVLWARMKKASSMKGNNVEVAEAASIQGRASRLSFTSDIRTMLVYSFPLFLGQFALSISAQYVVVVLAAISSNTQVGFYASAVNVTVAISLCSSAISQTLFPAFAHLDGMKGDVGRAFEYATKYMGFVIVPIIFLLMGSASKIIAVLYPPSYAPASPYLVILSFSNIAFLVGFGVLPSFFSGVGKPRLYLYYCIADAAAQVLLAPLLGIYAGLGIPGLIYSVLVSNLVGAIAGLALASKYLNSRIDVRSAVSILAASLVSYLAVLGLQTAASGLGSVELLVLDILVFSAVYLTVAPLVRAIGTVDITRLQTATGGMGRFRKVIGLVLRYEALMLRLAHIR